MPDNLYANVEQIFNHIDNDGLLVGNNAEWAKEAVVKSDYVSLDYFVPCMDIENMKKQVEEKIAYYRTLGSIAQLECWVEFKHMLNSLWEDPLK